MAQHTLDFLSISSMEIAHWIRASREAAQLKQDDLAEKLKKTRGNISAWENGRHEPSFSQILEISRITKHAVPIPGLGSSQFENDPAPTPGHRRVPLVDRTWVAQMSQTTEAFVPFPPNVALAHLLTDVELSDHAFALKVEGRSMEPQFHEGDHLIVDPAMAPLPGDFVIATSDHEVATLKKYRPRGINASGHDVFELVPLNQDYATINSEYEKVVIIGVVIEHRQVLRR
ncbi:LexA family protein [Pandoraea capi]|nr:LexA family transcriptional regulator [Pandoraea capi]